MFVTRILTNAAFALAASSIPAALALQAAPSAAEPLRPDTVSTSCPPDSTARVVEPSVADYPEIARQIGATGTAVVKVELTPSGSLAYATILQSSRNVYLDGAAIAAVRNSRFRPEIRDCAPAAGTYIYTVEFSA